MIRRIGGQQAAAEASLNMVFQLTRNSRGKWEVEAVRFSDGNWVPVETLRQALNLTRERQTRQDLGKLVEGIEQYKQTHKAPDAQSLFLRYAVELQLNPARFRRDVWSREVREKINRDILEGQMAQVRSVPAFFLNGKPIPNSRDEFEFEQRIVDGIRSLQ